MYRMQGVLALLALYVGLAHSFSWDVVVAGYKQLEFYDNNGTLTRIEDIPSYVIGSIAYDPVHNRVLFADETPKNFSIASFDIATGKIIFLVRSVQYAYVQIAYDPATQLLFWTETGPTSTNSILSKPGYTNAVEQNLLIKVNGDEKVYCITVDSCGGYIYWTTKSKIERARFDGSERQVVIHKNAYYGGGITIDHQTQKMYWLDNLYSGSEFQMSIESAYLNGENRRTLYVELDTFSFGALVASKDFIYWRTFRTFLQLTRNPLHDKKPKQFLLAQSSYPVGMASNYKIEDLLPINSETNDCASLNIFTDVSLLCVHGTKVNGESRCECTQGFIGERCEVSVCHNYCFQGDCSVSAEGQPKCRCNASYSGERCEVLVCQNDCFQGDCSANTERNFMWKADIVVAGKKQLEFYDNNGTRTHIEDIPSDLITSIAYDPVHNRVLFADLNSNNFTISSFDIATRKILLLVTSVHVYAYVKIAYDPARQLLFWTERDSKSISSILSKPGYTNTIDPNLLIKLDEDEIIDGITVDSCGGYIYWSTDSKIEKARFDGSNREVVIDKNVLYRGGIAIDHQTQKMYWLDNGYYGGRYQVSIESADFNGENRRTLCIERETLSYGALLVSKDFIYWRTHDTFSQFTRNPPHNKEVNPKQFLLAQSSRPIGMASIYKIEDQTQGIQNCEAQKSPLPNNPETKDCASLNVCTDVNLLCVHGTKVNGESRCECTQGYIGMRCDVSVCHDYCLQGDCSVSSEGQPKCRCNASYSGERCEVSVCQNYCFQGDCSASAEGQLMCRCKAGYSGERCEVNACHEYCSNNGVCSLTEESEPVCQCTGDYEGERCDVPVFLVKCLQTVSLLRDFLNTDVTPVTLSKGVKSTCASTVV